MSHRKRLVLVAGAAVVLAVLYSAAWLGISLLTLRAAEQWADLQRQQGAAISYAEPRFGNFPKAPVVTFPSVSLTLPAHQGGWRWQAENVSASVLPWAIDDLLLDLAGTHVVSAPQTEIAPLHLAAQTATLRVHLDAGAANAGRFDAENMTAASANHAPLWKADRVSLDFTKILAPEPSSKLVLETDNLTLSEIMPPPFSRTIRRIRLTTELQGPLQGGPLARTLENWRVAGGDLEIRDVYVDWEPLTVAGNGTLALDEALQPIGAFALRFTGFFAGVDALTTQGAITPANASLAKIMLGLMAKAPPGGGAPELSLPITLQGGRLLAGPVTLMEVPQVEWSKNVVLP